jgi:hypothetical protein
VTAPLISAVLASSVGGSTAAISWTTDEPAQALVESGETTAYGYSTQLSQSLSTAHSVALGGLKPDTQYHYRIKAWDAAGNPAISEDFTFRTLEDLPSNSMTLPLMRTQDGSRAPQASWNGEHVGIALVNADSQPANVKFTAVDATGKALDNPAILNPVTRTLRPGEQLPILDSQLFGSGIAGTGSDAWVRVESSTARMTGLYMIFDDDLTVWDGANLSDRASCSFVLPEIQPQGFNRISLVNPHAEAANLIFELCGPDGTVQTATLRTMPGGSMLQGELFLDFFPGFTPNPQDYVRVRATRSLRSFMTMGRTREFVRTLNGQDAQRGSSRLYSPQIAWGGEWRSSLSIVNLDPTPGNVTVRLIRDDGTVMGRTRVLPVPAYGKIMIDNPACFEELAPAKFLQGYAELVSDGIRIGGSVTFSDPEQRRFSSSLPLVASLQNSILFSHMASSDRFFTGIAMLNPGDSAVTVTLDLYGSNGMMECTSTVAIPAMTRRSGVLTEFFPALAGMNRTSGYVRVTSDSPIAACALFGTRDLSALSAIPAQDLP